MIHNHMRQKTRIRIISAVTYSAAAIFAGLMVARFEPQWCILAAIFAGLCGFFLGPFVFSSNRWVSYIWVVYNSLLIPGLSLLLTGVVLAPIYLILGRAGEQASVLSLIGAPLMFGAVVYPFLFLIACFASCILLFAKSRV